MLSATSTRDLNQAARAAEKYLQTLGFELAHSKALDLVAHMVGFPHHMAAQSTLPAATQTTTPEPHPVLPRDLVEAIRQLVFGAEYPQRAMGKAEVSKDWLEALYRAASSTQNASRHADALETPTQVSTYADLLEALATLTPQQLQMTITVSEGCDDNGNAEFFPGFEFLRADSNALDAGANGVLEPEQPVLLFNQQDSQVEADAGMGRPSVPFTVVDDLCKVLTNRDVEAALHEVGISDAANAALVQAAPYVTDRVLADFSLDALQQAYDDLPTSVDAEEFSEGHGNWSLSEEDYRLAKRLADALYAGKRQRAEELSSMDQRRMCAQFELLSGKPAAMAREYMASKSNLHDEVVRHFKKVHDVELRMGPWLLASDKKNGFWCEPHGWTPSRDAASGFTDGVRHTASLGELTTRLAGDIQWVRYSEVADYKPSK